jgi:hypothetical protein
MGDKWEVHAWEGGFPHDNTGSPYRYVQKYRGPSFVKACIVFVKAKKSSGCVKIEWR